MLVLTVLHSQACRDTYKLILVLKTLSCCCQKLMLEASVVKRNSAESWVEGGFTAFLCPCSAAQESVCIPREELI